MANEFVTRNGLLSLDNSVISGSLIVTNGITGSLLGTSSISVNALTASSADNLTVRGTLTAQTIVAQTITSSILYSSGSNIFGNSLTNTQSMTGSVSITGSLTVNGSSAVLSNQTSSTMFVQGGNSFGSQALLGTNDTQNLAFETSGSVRMFVSSSGLVGIGTTSPVRIFTINGGSSPSRVLLQNTNSGFTIGNGFDIILDNSGNTQVWNYQNGVMQFATNNTERLRITSGGDVGIGTSSPFGTSSNRTVLSVNGTTDVSLNVGSGGTQRAYLYGSSTYAELGTIGSLPLTFAPNNTERMRITSGGDVGIGTTSPGRTLHVLGQTGIGTVLKLEGASGTTTYLQLAYNGATNAQSGYIGYNNSSQMQFFTNDTLRATIDASGNLGLGVTPSAWLNTLNALQIGAAHLFGQTTGTGTVSLGNNVFLNSTPAYIYQYNGKATRYSQYDGQHEFYTAPSGTAGNAITFTQAMTLNASGNLAINDTTTTSASGYNWIRINGSTGGVLELTSASSRVVQLQSNGTSAGGVLQTVTDSPLAFGTNGSEKMRITSAGNVGIGTTSPGQLLQVHGGSLLVNTGTSATAYRDIMMGGIGGWATGESHGIDTVYGGSASPTTFTRIESYFDGSSASMYFRNFFNSSSPQTSILMTIRGSGNVGIGVTSPQAPLHVIAANSSNDALIQEWSYTAGTTDVYSLMLKQTVTANVVRYNFSMVNNSTAYNDVLVLDRGNVGIGTTSPGEKLHVVGKVRIFDAGYPYIDLGINTSNYWRIINDNPSDTFVIGKNGTTQFTITSGGNVGIGTTSPSARLFVSGSTNVVGVQGSGSAAPLMFVDGANGRLFEVTDDLSNSLFSVNTIAGLPVIEAFANNCVSMGQFGGHKFEVTCTSIRGGKCTSASGYLTFVGGGKCNTASGYYSFIGGGGNNCATGTRSFIGGGYNNTTSGIYYYSTIVNGEGNCSTGAASFIGAGVLNTASSNCSAIVGGACNQATCNFSTVGGGSGNCATNFFSTVGGGCTNRAQGTRSTISGGDNNIASGQYSFVGGGFINTASGYMSSVLGGRNNNINGYTNSHIVGSCIGASADNYTYVNNLCQTGGGISDCRVKNTIQPLEFGLDHITKLQPVSFCWNGDVSCHKKYGFIAQNVQQAMSCVVTCNPLHKLSPFGTQEVGGVGESLLEFEKDAVYASYVNAFKDLKAENDALKQRIDIIENILKQNGLL